jgi:hypothetical protein
MAGVHISHVYVGVTGEHVQSTNNRGVVAISGDEREVVGRRAARRRRLEDHQPRADRQIIHALPRHFTIDGHDGVTDPLGMSGAGSKSTRTSSPAATTFITNVLKCVHRAGLEPAGIVFEPLASSAATLLAEEKHVGVRAARHRRRHDRHRGLRGRRRRSTARRFRSAATSSPTTSRSGSRRRSPKRRTSNAPTARGSIRTTNGSRRFTSSRSTAAARAKSRRAQLRAIVAAARARDLPAGQGEHRERLPRDVSARRGRHDRRRRAPARHRARASEFFGLPVRIGVPTTIGGLTDAVRNPNTPPPSGSCSSARAATAPHLNGTNGKTCSGRSPDGSARFGTRLVCSGEEPTQLVSFRRTRWADANVSFPNTPRRSRSSASAAAAATPSTA